MNSQRIEQSLRQILDRCGAEIIQNHNQFKSAIFDLLDSINYADERLVLKHAMDSSAFWMLLGASKITTDSIKRAVEQIQKESHMTKEDAEFVVQCVAAAHGVKTDMTVQKPSQPETVVPRPSNQSKSVSEYPNVLMRDCPEQTQYSETVLGSNVRRDSIRSVTFLNTLKSMPSTAWDVSWGRDGSVMAWTEQNNKKEKMLELYIGADGSIKGKDCCGLFADYKNVETINFNNCFDTSQATDMSLMFSKCIYLKKLDVASFDTGQVTDMSQMFVCCRNLAELDVSGFDTSQVKRMQSMFMACGNLTKLDVSRFDTSRVTDMGMMFLGCSNLKKLDISNFDTSQATDMGCMFMRCGITGEEAGLRMK